MNQVFFMILSVMCCVAYSAEVVLSFDQPAPKISGIGYDDNQLWVVSQETNAPAGLFQMGSLSPRTCTAQQQ